MLGVKVEQAAPMQSAGIAILLVAVAATLHGCGGGGDGGDGKPKGPPQAVPSGPTLPLVPLRSVSYISLPNPKYQSGDVLPAQDMMQQGYAAQWGPDGRDDLGLVKTLGGNAVRLYHSMGLESQHDHSGFLDRAKDIGIHVLPGFHTQMQDQCPGFNCFEYWKKATLDAFDKGFMTQNKSWHPALSVLTLLEEPDSEVAASQSCSEKPKNKCWIRAVLSAMDGVLAAEKARGVSDQTSKVNFTAAWSFSQQTSADGSVTGTGFFGFQDIALGANNPVKYGGYSPQVGPVALAAAFHTRWTHSMSAAADQKFLQEQIFAKIKPLSAVQSTPWFISSFKVQEPYKTSDVLQKDLQFLDGEAKKGGPFLGVSIFQLQKAYQEGVDNGLFKLGSTAGPINITSQVCHEDVNTKVPVCAQYPVFCFDHDENQYRTLPANAGVVAAAWNGAVKGRGLCTNSPKNELALPEQLVI